MSDMRRFGFADSSGILNQDQFFGTGLLIVKNVGDVGDKLCKNAQPAKTQVNSQKSAAVDQMLRQGKKDEVIRLLRSNHRFEMKFDNVRKSMEPFYEKMVDIFLSDPENRFSAMVVNRKNPSFDHNGVEDSWETYTKYVASLVVKEMVSLPSDDELCIVVDEITKPRKKILSLEDTLMGKIRDELTKYPHLDFNKVFGALSIESHSSMPMQLCDVLLGSVMYDYKKREGSVSATTEAKKEELVKKIRSSLGVGTLANEFTDDSKAYFNVFEAV